MGYSEPDKIIVRGKDLCAELIGKVGFSSMFFLELTGRLPTAGETCVLDAVLVTLMEHGMTPAAISTRLTWLGAPQFIQGAVAAGILGAGDTYLGSFEECAKALQSLAVHRDAVSRGEAIERYLNRVDEAGSKVPGIGHPIHRPIDPRALVLLELAAKALHRTDHAETLDELQQHAERRYARLLPVNAGGAIAAVLSDIGLDWRICRGFAVVGRSAGLVGHLYDEMQNPIAKDVWSLVDETVEYVDPAPDRDQPPPAPPGGSS